MRRRAFLKGLAGAFVTLQMGIRFGVEEFALPAEMYGEGPLTATRVLELQKMRNRRLREIMDDWSGQYLAESMRLFESKCDKVVVRKMA